MTAFIEFLLRSAVTLIVLYLFYWLALRNDTHFHLNRLYLVFALIASVLIPALHNDLFTRPAVISGLPSLTMDLGAITETVQQLGREPADPGPTFGILEVLALIYAIGALVVFGRLIYQAVFIHALTRLSGKTHHKGYTLVNMRSGTTPFSYFRRIFIPVEQLDAHSLNDIIAHEQSHLQQGHFIDLFLINFSHCEY